MSMSLTKRRVAPLETALKDGGRMHVFLSGGGLRVVRIEKAGELVAYGEHPYIADAMLHTAEDYVAGGRPYEEVYGSKRRHYLTGSSKPNSELDALVRQGDTFDVTFEDGQFVCAIHGYAHQKSPEGVDERARNGEVIEWEARGYRFRTSPFTFPGNGEKGSSTEIVSKPAGRNNADPWMWHTTQTGRADTFMGAITAATTAPSVEDQNQKD